MAESTLSILLQLKDEATSQLDKFGKTLNDSKKEIESMSKSAAIAGGVIVGAMGMAMKAAEDERSNIAQLNTMLKNVGVSYDQVSESLERNIKATQRKTGIADNEQRDVLGRLLLVTHDYNKALSLLPLTLDLAAAGQMDASTAATYLAKAMLDLENGAESVTVRLGQASMQFKSLEEIQARVGGTAEATANRFAILRAELNDLYERIGTALLPVLQTLVDNILPIVDAVGEWIDKNPELIRQIMYFGAALLAAAAVMKTTAILMAVINALSGPKGWIALGLAVAVAGGSYLLLNEALEDTEEAFAADTEAMNKANKGAQSFDSTLSTLPSTVGRVTSSIKDLSGDFNEFTGQLIGDINRYLIEQQAIINFEDEIIKNRRQMQAEIEAGRATGGINRILNLQRAAAEGEISDTQLTKLIGETVVTLPGYAAGGIVPGPIGQPVPIIAHGGERFLGNSGESSAKNNETIIINLDGQKIAQVVRERFFNTQRYSRTTGIS